MPTHLCPATGIPATPQEDTPLAGPGSHNDLLELPESSPVGHTSSRLKRLDPMFGFIISALPTKSPWIGAQVFLFLTPSLSSAQQRHAPI